MARTIVVTGKGGVGKSTVAALMISYLKEHASGAVLAVDADADANLGTILGVPVANTIGNVREETLANISKLPAGMDKAAYIEAGLHEVLVETPKVDFLSMGRPEGPGCYCYINNLLRKFSEDLLTSYEWLVMDSEAGMEHLSRRTAARVDHLVLVINRNPLSIDCARRITEVIASVKNDVRNKHVLINGVPENAVQSVQEKAADLDAPYLGHIPYDEAVEENIFSGRSLYDLVDSRAVDNMAEMMQKLGA